MWLRALTVLGLVLQTRALHFYIQANEERCFLEELPSDTIVEGIFPRVIPLLRFVQVLIWEWDTAHYKALEWVEDSQSWFVNEAMGIQVQVEVGDKEEMRETKGKEGS